MVTSNFISNHNAVTTNNSYETNVLHQAAVTKLIVNNQELGTGTLFVTKSNVLWKNSANTGIPRKLSLLYPTISFYGIQKSPTPALYMVVNFEISLALPELNLDYTFEDNIENPDEETFITEIKFVPQNENDLNDIHSALNEGQRLHPDPADELSDDSDGIDDMPDVFQQDHDDVVFGLSQVLFDDVPQDYNYGESGDEENT